MDLTAEQSTRLVAFINDWSKDSRLELETTFGVGGVVDSTTFLQIAQRLRAKGFKAYAQEDRLNILTPKHIRFTLEGLDVLQTYCKEDQLDKKSFTAMIKDRAFPDSNVDVDEYDLRFKIRREEELGKKDTRIREMLKAWKTQQKAFRLIRRWSFEGKGVRVDLSMVRQTPNVPGKSELQWSTRFLEKSVLQEVPRYEVEVELLHKTEFTATPALALKALISGVGEVLRAIQKNVLLLRKSVANNVRQEYKQLVRGDKFRGVGPVTLETKNMGQEVLDGVPNIRTGYNVTDKADGLRTMGFVTADGDLYLIDQSLNVYRTGLRNPACKQSLVDGEWVTQTKEGDPIHHFLLFDIYYAPDGEDVSKHPFALFKEGIIDLESESRYAMLKQWYATWMKDTAITAKGLTIGNALMIAVKDFYFSPPGATIFTHGCSVALETPRRYHTDGLILTSNSHRLPEKLGVRFPQQFKWKPAKDNTVDFLVSFEKDKEYAKLDLVETTEDPDTKEIIQYKTMRLYVGGSKSKEEAHPRETILYLLLDQEMGPGPAPRYRPVLFHPMDNYYPMSNTAYIAITRDPETYEEYAVTVDSKEPIRHHSIVEMRYDPTRRPGWRWIPSRIRHDKTERLLRAIAAAAEKDMAIKYTGMMNDEAVANSVWSSIHDPVTESMIRNGTEEPTMEELKAMMPSRPVEVDAVGVEEKYYERKAPEENLALIKGLRDFHNKYIKNELLLKRALMGYNKTILDLACGKAGDLYKWIGNHARKVIGIDTVGDNITNPIDGAYRRYMDILREKKQGDRLPPKMAFVVGNSSIPLVDGSAGATPEEKDILRSIFGRADPEGAVPPYIQQHFAGSLRAGADVAACMFALHYFFENPTVLNGFLDNLANSVSIGGHFIGCCFDGQRVFELLEGIPRGETKTGKEADTPIWSITKDYEADRLTGDESSVGLAIDVNFISIGLTHREYLVPFEYLTERLRLIGFRLLYPDELRTLQLERSTATFDHSYRMTMGSDGESKYYMPKAVQQYSFLHRWFIFKREGASATDITVPVQPPSVMAEAPENMRFNFDLTRVNKTYALYSIVESSAYSVLKPWEKPTVNTALRTWFQPTDKIRRIIDATAHIGVDTINFSNQFPNALIDAYEIVPETYSALVKNIAKFKKQERIRPHNEDITLWEPMVVIDFLYVDPPWGGKQYAEQETLDLYLQKEGNDHNESKNINVFIDKWFDSGKIRNIVLKAPRNFNKTYLAGKYDILEQNVMNRSKKEIAYTLYRFKAPYIPNEVEAEAETEAKADADDKKEEASKSVKGKEPLEEEKEMDLISRLTQPKRTFKEKDIFTFGPGAALRDTLKIQKDLTIKKEQAGRWLSLSAPFPIPDRDLKDRDGNPVMYPTTEHYMAAMKYVHASNHPEMAIGLFSTMSSTHQAFLIKRRMSKTTYGSGTADDYKLLEDEIKTVKDKLASTYASSHGVVFDEMKWTRPMRGEDPLTMRFRILYDALSYRWEKDLNFRTIVLSAKEQNKYLLYSIGPDSDKSDLAGKLEIAKAYTGHIRGGNRVGLFMMEIAEFNL